MNGYTPGEAVKVYIGGKDRAIGYEQGECTAVFDTGQTVTVNFAMWSGEFPGSWVESVIPPCPWTEDLTVIAYTSKEGPRRAILLDGKWHQLPSGPIRDARDQTTCIYSWESIARHHPIRLAPEKPAHLALRDNDGTIWLPAPGRPYLYADSRDLTDRSYIERNYGPLAEVSS